MLAQKQYTEAKQRYKATRDEYVQAHAAKGGLIPGTAMVDGVAAPPPVSVPKSPGIPTTAAQVRVRVGLGLGLG